MYEKVGQFFKLVREREQMNCLNGQSGISASANQGICIVKI